MHLLLHSHTHTHTERDTSRAGLFRKCLPQPALGQAEAENPELSSGPPQRWQEPKHSKCTCWEAQAGGAAGIWTQTPVWDPGISKVLLTVVLDSCPISESLLLLLPKYILFSFHWSHILCYYCCCYFGDFCCTLRAPHLLSLQLMVAQTQVSTVQVCTLQVHSCRLQEECFCIVCLWHCPKTSTLGNFAFSYFPLC